MSTQTCICTKIFKVVIFRWWQLSDFLILFYTFLNITHTMRPWSQLVSENLISLKWPPLLPDASLTVLWDKVLCFFSRAPVGWPLQQLTLWQPLVPGCRWPLLPEPALPPPSTSRGRTSLSFPRSAEYYLGHRPVFCSPQCLYNTCTQISAPTPTSCGSLS